MLNQHYQKSVERWAQAFGNNKPIGPQHAPSDLPETRVGVYMILSGLRAAGISYGPTTNALVANSLNILRTKTHFDQPGDVVSFLYEANPTVQYLSERDPVDVIAIVERAWTRYQSLN